MLALLYHVSAVFYLFLAIVLIPKIKHERYFLYFLLILVGIAFWSYTLYMYLFVNVGDYLLLLGRMNYAAGVVIAYGITSFFYQFPFRSFKLPTIITKGFLWYSIFLFLICLFTPWIDKSEMLTQSGPVVTLGEYYFLYAVHLGISIVAPIIFGVRKLFVLQGLDKTRFYYSFFIFVPSYSLGYLLATILPIFGIQEFFQYLFLVFVPGILFTFYSLTYHRFFNFSYKYLKVLRTFLFASLIILVSLSSFVFLSSIFIQEIVEIYFLISMMVGFFSYFILQKVFPEFIPKKFQEFRDILEEMKVSIYYSESYEEFLKKLETIFILQLHFSFLKVLIVQNKEDDLGIPGYLSDGVSEFIEKHQFKILTRDIIGKTGGIDEISKSMLEESLDNLQADILFCFYIEKKLRGFLILGNTETNKEYSSEYIAEFIKARKPLEIAFINVLLKKNLQEENSLMKQVIQERTAELRKQYQDMKQLVQQQSDFIALTSHEFRTPLSIALFQLEDTIESHSHSSNVVEELDDVISSLDRLKTLTEKLFNVEQYDLEKIQLVKDTVAFHVFFQKIFSQFQSLFQEKQIQFSCIQNLPEKFSFSADESQLSQLFHNLLGNAYKFTPNSGKVEIRSCIKNAVLQIEIADSGKGIPDEDKPTIFQKFRTVDIAQGMGLGLGLYICKKIVELHEGEIFVEDDEALGGAKFVIQFPLI